MMMSTCTGTGVEPVSGSLMPELLQNDKLTGGAGLRDAQNVDQSHSAEMAMPHSKMLHA